MELLSLYLKHKSVCTDTRKIKKGDVFFALKGPNFNGNKFAKDALLAGASAVVIDEEEYYVEGCVLVPDVLLALQTLATDYRKYLDIPVIAVTGSNGKTTTKELITKVLSQKYKVFATVGNLNNHIGVPLSILSMDQETEMAVLELGANHIGEIEELCKIAMPDYGLITNCGKDHLEGYGSIEGVIKGSSELFEYLKLVNGTAFVNKGDEIVNGLASNIDNVVYYPQEAHVGKNDFFVEVVFKNEIIIQSNLIGEFNFINIACALSIGEYFGVEPKLSADAIASYVPNNNRSQVVKKDDVTYILDAYNANPSSMGLALRSFSVIKTAPKMVVLGDMFELGDYSFDEHRVMVDQALGLGFDEVVFCGNEFAKHKNDKAIFLCDRDSLKSWIQSKDLRGYTILLKGSRGMALEKLLD